MRRASRPRGHWGSSGAHRVLRSARPRRKFVQEQLSISAWREDRRNFWIRIRGLGQVAAWRRHAEEEHRVIDWRFRVDDARRVFRYEGLTARRSEH